MHQALHQASEWFEHVSPPRGAHIFIYFLKIIYICFHFWLRWVFVGSVWAFSGCGKQELFPRSCMALYCDLLLVELSPPQAAVAEAHGISCSAASGIFLD